MDDELLNQKITSDLIIYDDLRVQYIIPYLSIEFELTLSLFLL